MTEWPGDERRSIPIHILNHVDERLGTHIGKVETLFSDHTRDEMDRYQEIMDRIERNNEENVRRHGELCRSFESYAEKTEQIYESFCAAFLSTPQGKPDFHGHARAHESWVEERKDDKEFKAYIRKVVAAAATIAVGSWLLLLAWQAVLAGPK